MRADQARARWFSEGRNGLSRARFNPFQRGDRQRKITRFHPAGYADRAFARVETLTSRRRWQARARRALAYAKKVFALSKALESAGALRSSEWRSLRAYIERQTGVRALEWCDSKHRTNLIESLKGWGLRVGADVSQ